jgi:hypothetical protein
VEALIERAKEFRVAVEGLVMQETKDWASEFQNNIAELEKDVTAQLNALKAQSEKAAQARDAARQPGSIQLTVPNAGQSASGTFQVQLEGASGVVADEMVTGSKTWVWLNLVPGHYRATVSATVSGKLASTAAAVIVKPGEVAQPEIALPI